MKKPRHRDPTDAPAAPPAPEDRFGGMRPLAIDDDERPSREDKAYGETIFNRATVPLPGFLTGRKKRRKP